jgi:homoserine kinase
MIRISVPCSTSNLGPGFDSLGLALSLSLDVELRPSEERVVTRHGDELFSAVTDADDLFLRALSHRRSALGLSDEPFAAALRSAIPTGRGLGSSAAAVVAGVMAADALAGRSHDPIDVLRAATEIEGHPDNAAPAILGGLCCAVVDQDVHAACISSLADVRAVVASPEGAFPTKASRGALPATLDHKAATASLGRAVFLSHALRDGRTDGLSWAFRDAFHQPYRVAPAAGTRRGHLRGARGGRHRGLPLGRGLFVHRAGARRSGAPGEGVGGDARGLRRGGYGRDDAVALGARPRRDGVPVVPGRPPPHSSAQLRERSAARARC